MGVEALAREVKMRREVGLAVERLVGVEGTNPECDSRPSDLCCFGVGSFESSSGEGEVVRGLSSPGDTFLPVKEFWLPAVLGTGGDDKSLGLILPPP